jgi:putative transposase
MIAHVVGLYFRFGLSSRAVEELLFARGVVVSYEAIRQWCRTFGQAYAHQLRDRRPQSGETWHLDEVFRTIQGERHYLWRASRTGMCSIAWGNVDATSTRRRRSPHIPQGLEYVPRVLITEKLASDGAATRER